MQKDKGRRCSSICTSHAIRFRDGVDAAVIARANLPSSWSNLGLRQQLSNRYLTSGEQLQPTWLVTCRILLSVEGILWERRERVWSRDGGYQGEQKVRCRCHAPPPPPIPLSVTWQASESRRRWSPYQMTNPGAHIRAVHRSNLLDWILPLCHPTTCKKKGLPSYASKGSWQSKKTGQKVKDNRDRHHRTRDSRWYQLGPAQSAESRRQGPWTKGSKDSTGPNKQAEQTGRE